MAPPQKTSNVSPRDLEVAALVWQCFKTEPQIDYAKLSQLASFKNPASAAACWGSTKKRLLANSPAGASATASPRKRGAKATATDDNDNDTAGASPAKKRRGRKSAAALPPTPPKQPTDEDDDDQEPPCSLPPSSGPATGDARIKNEPKDDKDAGDGVAVCIEAKKEPGHTFFDTFNPFEDDESA